MGEWAGYAISVTAALIAFLALLATLAYRWLVGHKREFQVLLERIDKEAEKRERETRELTARIDREAAERQRRFDKQAEERERETRELAARIDREAAERQQRFDKEAEKREQAIQAALERSDRTFETLIGRNNELMKELAGIAQRTARSEATLEVITTGRRPAASKSPAAADEPGTVAAQQLPGDLPAE